MDKKPKYIKLFENLRDKINNGEYKANEKLPSKRDLAINLNISINTVINAYNLLLDEGYIYSKEKKGYYVVSQLVVTTKNDKLVDLPTIKHKYKYDFTTANVEEFKSTSFKRIIKEQLNNSEYLMKSSYLGSEALRIEIANHLEKNRGINTSYNNIVIMSGLEDLERILKLLDIDNITLENPGYHKLSIIAKNINKAVNYISLDSEGCLVPSYKTILYTTPFNQFPTGVKMSIKRKKELVTYLSTTNSYLIEDDFDAEFRINSSPTTSLYTLDNSNVIFFSTFSTTLYPGLRLAYAILPSNLLKLYKEKYQSYASFVPMLLQLTLKDFIKDGYYASFINRRKKAYINKRLKAMETLDKYNIKYNEKANYLSLLVDIGKNVDNSLLKKLKDNDINIEALSSFDINKEKSNYLILGYTAINIDEIEKGIGKLKKIIGD